VEVVLDVARQGRYLRGLVKLGAADGAFTLAAELLVVVKDFG